VKFFGFGLIRESGMGSRLEQEQLRFFDSRFPSSDSQLFLMIASAILVGASA